MSGKSTDPLSPSEWKVMKIVWEKRSCAARDVHQAAAQTDGWAVSTVKTILRRLVDKGYLKTTQVGNSFLYRPVRGALKSLYGAADTLLDNALDGTVGPLLAYMARKSQLSAEELAELKQLLGELTPSEEDER
jgi:predicted transcriptional regulator